MATHIDHVHALLCASTLFVLLKLIRLGSAAYLTYHFDKVVAGMHGSSWYAYIRLESTSAAKGTKPRACPLKMAVRCMGTVLIEYIHHQGSTAPSFRNWENVVYRRGGQRVLSVTKSMYRKEGCGAHRGAGQRG